MKKLSYFEKRKNKVQLELYQKRGGKKFVSRSRVLSVDKLVLIIEKLFPI